MVGSPAPSWRKRRCIKTVRAAPTESAAAAAQRGELVRVSIGGRARAALAVLTASTLTVALLAGAGARTAVAGTSTPAADCQPFSGQPCLLPFPSNLFTRADRRSQTGLRVAIPARDMPVNAEGVRISPAPYGADDGFSPGSALIVHVPGLDNQQALRRTGPPQLLDMGRSYARGAPIVVIDERTGRRQLIYAQLDANAPTPQTRNLMILPGSEWADGQTYVVALRDLRDAQGGLIRAPAWFERLRDGRPLPAAERSQRGRYARIFAVLRRAGIARSRTLYEAWDFTVASERSLTGRLLGIRNSAFAQLGDRDLASGHVSGRAPEFHVTSDTVLTAKLHEVLGTFRVPCYLTVCGPAATTGFHFTSGGLYAIPSQIPHNTATALFECIVPDSATPSHRARISLYGHGLLGSMAEVSYSWVQQLATGYNMTFCATNWWGLADPDTPFDIRAVQNLNLFPNVVDRLQQGVLNTLFLGRLMDNSRGFATSPAFRSAGRPVIDTRHLYYDGNSQGGIEGGITTAVSPDFRHAVLGVTGMDYGNVLVQRSTDFAPFKALLDAAYPDPSMYPVILDLIDQLWDRGDPEGYATHMTAEPLPGTPSHEVLMQIAYGDFQVSMYAGAAEARAIGARAYEPALDPDRSRDRNLFFGIPAIPRFPYHGSAVEIWDSGPGRVQPPPVANVPPVAGPHNIDPHENPRDTPAAQRQISAFLAPDGAVIDVCGGRPCHSLVFTR
jgi:hypothetical protein